jgi:N-methylhydantoinase A
MKRLAVDVGGTFTDLIYWDDQEGHSIVHKVPSTPSDPSIATMNGVRDLRARAGVSDEQMDMFFHGTTVATNIVLQHSGAKVGLITTHGFRDILHIARKKRPLNFSSHQSLPWQEHALVLRRHRRTVRERISAAGEIVEPLDEGMVRDAARLLKSEGVEAVAICFLNAYRNPVHEDRARDILLEEFPGVFVSTSNQVAPQYREYERFSTTALNSYVGPPVSEYVNHLSEEVQAEGVAEGVHLMTSAGGLITARGAAETPVALLMSGVVAGLLAGCEIGRASGFSSVITLDVGGTSADVGVAPGGKLRMKHLLDTRIGDYHAMVPMAEVDTIGAGGGSIARVDEAGMFLVGPQSAGALPGPVCYGHGGTEPTLTDAVTVLGWLRAKALLGGQMTIDTDAARTVIADEIASKLDTSTEFAALGVFQILSNAMADAISLHSVRKGYDPRDFVLVPEGGAGPLFAWDIAQRMGIPKVVIPRHPGIASAMGLLTTDVHYETPVTVWQVSTDFDPVAVEAAFTKATTHVLAQLRADDLPDAAIRVERVAECRYDGQGYELRVPVPDGPIDEAWLKATVDAFEDAHERTYFQRFHGKPVQIINIRAVGIGTVPKLTIPEIERGSADSSHALSSTTQAWFAAGDGHEPEPHETGVYNRELLLAGNVIEGPALIEQFDSTTVVGPDQRVTVDAVGHLILEGSLR